MFLLINIQQYLNVCVFLLDSSNIRYNIGLLDIRKSKEILTKYKKLTGWQIDSLYETKIKKNSNNSSCNS